MPDVVRTITIRGSTQGISEATAQLRELALSQGNVAVASEQVTRSSLTVERALERATRQVDGAFKATRQLAQVQSVFQRALDQGLITQERFNDLMSRSTGLYSQNAAAAEELAREIEAAARASIQEQRALEATAATLDENYRAARQLAQAQEQLRRGLVQGRLTQEQFNHLMERAEEQYRRATAANDNFGHRTKLTRYELINLSRQIQDVGVSLASGQSFFNVLIQQGTQIGDVFASSTATLGGFARQIAAMITPMRVLGVAVVAVGAAAVASLSAWKNYTLALDDAAKSAGFATTEFARLQQAAAVKGIGQQDLAGGMARFAQSVRDAQAGMGPLAEWFRLNGQQIGTQQQTLERVADILNRMPNDVQRLNALQEMGLPATAEFLRLLEGGGAALRQRISETKDLGSTLDRELIIKARAFEEAWNKAWEDFKIAGRNAIFSVAQFFEMLSQAGNKTLTFLNVDVGRNLMRAGQGFKLFSPADAKQITDFYDSVRGKADAAAEAERAAGEARLKLIVSPADLRHALQLENQRIQLLGDLATVNEKVRLTENAIKEARLSGVQLTETEIKNIITLARLREESSRTQQRAALELMTVEEALLEVERQLAILRMTGIVSAEQEAAARAKLTRNLLEQIPLYRDLSRAAENFVTSFVQGIASGEKATEALTKSLRGLTSSLISLGGSQVRDALTSAFGAFNQAGGGLAGLSAGFSAFGATPAGPLGLALMGIGSAITGLISMNQRREQRERDLQERAAESQRALGERLDALRERVAQASANTETLAGALAEFDRRAALERRGAAALGGKGAPGGEEGALLEQALAAERLAIIERFNDQAIAEEKRRGEEIARIRQDLDDRLFAATVDTATLAGQLLAFDRNAAREREAIALESAELLPQLEQTLQAERLQIIRDANEEALEEQRRAAEEFAQFIAQVRQSIQQFINNLRAGSGSFLSPSGRLQAAQAAFSQQLGLAQTGDQAALSSITQSAQNLIEAARAVFGSTGGFQSIVAGVISQLEALPGQVEASNPVVNAIEVAQSTNDALLSQLVGFADTNNDGIVDQNELLNFIKGNTNTTAVNVAANNSLTAATNSLIQVLDQVQDLNYNNLRELTNQSGWLSTIAELSNEGWRSNQTGLAQWEDGSPEGGKGSVPLFASGGVLSPYSVGIMGEHHPEGPFLVRAGSSPVPISPSMPGGAGGDLYAELRALREEVALLRADNNNITLESARGVAGAVLTAADRRDRDDRQMRNRPAA